MSRAPRRHDRTDREKRRLHFDVSWPIGRAGGNALVERARLPDAPEARAQAICHLAESHQLPVSREPDVRRAMVRQAENVRKASLQPRRAPLERTQLPRTLR